jgi:hypothetical protein
MLSVIPGLAQLLQGRFRAVYRYVIAWLALLLTGIVCYSTSMGVAVFSIVIVLHAWVAADGALILAKSRGIRPTLAVIALLSAAVFGLYCAVRVTLLSGYDTGRAGLDVPYYRVRLNDVILCRRVAPDRLHRGDLVLVRQVPVTRNVGFGMIVLFRTRGPDEIVAQIVGLPGDRVTIKGSQFELNGRLYGADAVPVRRTSTSASITLGNFEYYVTIEPPVVGSRRHAAIPRGLLGVRNPICTAGEIRGRGWLRIGSPFRVWYLKDME